jgi:gamma-glutamylcyclotransferase (GGCT)/AIG2-like uncharacterized protein YtfP
MSKTRSKTPELEHVFVYGTLRPPRADTPEADSRYYPQVAPYIWAVTSAQLLEGTLYDLGAYPAARPGADIVQGDLLVVEPAALVIMDRLEGHPAFFQRAKVVVQSETRPVEAWIYWAPADLVFGRRRIVGGDWLQRNSEETILSEVESRVDQGVEVDDTLRALVQRFAEAECSWLSSVRPGGRAHSAPLWHVWHRGRVYVVTLSTAVKTANILEHPGVVITHPDPVDAIIIEGWATLALGLSPQLQPLFAAKYDWDIDNSLNYDTIIEITPTKLLAWGKYGQGRWSGAEVLRVWYF